MARDATARHGIQDADYFGANLFMYDMHNVVDEVELIVFKFFGSCFPHPTSLSIPCLWAEFTRLCVHVYTYTHHVY